MQLVQLMAEITGEPPRLWASRIIGFGRYRYRLASGREGDAPLAAFASSPRQHTLYLEGDLADRYATQLARLGSFTRGKSCMYVRRLADIDLDILGRLVRPPAPALHPRHAHPRRSRGRSLRFNHCPPPGAAASMRTAPNP